VGESATADFAAARAAAARRGEAEAARLPTALHRAAAEIVQRFSRSTAVARAVAIPVAASPAAVLPFNRSRAQANRRLRSQEIPDPDLESRDLIGPEPANRETGPAIDRAMATGPADREKVTVPEIGLEMATNPVNPAKAIAQAIDPETAIVPADPETATVPVNPEKMTVPEIDPVMATAPAGRVTATARENRERATARENRAMATAPIVPEFHLANDQADREIVLQFNPSHPAIARAIDPAIDPTSAIGHPVIQTDPAHVLRTGTDIGKTCITAGTTGTGTGIGITAAPIGTPIRGAPGALPRAPSVSRPG